MSTGDLLSVDPQELQFPFELKKQISCALQLRNKTNDSVAFKVKTTNPNTMNFLGIAIVAFGIYLVGETAYNKFAAPSHSSSSQSH